MEKKIRVLLGKVGCDIHERGAFTMMTAFRDAGMEVIYTGRFQVEESIVNAAIAEDVDVIGISDLTGSFPIISEKIIAGLKAQGVDIPLVCGGIMTPDDMKVMEELGVAGMFPTGYPIDEAVNKVIEIVNK